MSAANHLSRRSFLRIAGGAVGLAALTACAPAVAPAGEGGPEQSVSVNFWMWNTYAPDADDILEQGILNWAAENGMDIEISRDSDSDMASKLMPAVEAGTLPDAFFTDAQRGVMVMEAGGLADISDLWDPVGEAHGGWQPRLKDYVTRDGMIGFMPYSIDTPMVHYREDIFEEAGITVPEGQWTWDETRDLCMQAQQFTEESGNPMVGWGFGVVKVQHDGWCDDLMRNFGADIWDETGQNIILKEQSSEQTARALTFAKEAFDMGLFPNDAASWDYSSNNKSYQEDQAILVINAASIFTWAQENKPELAEVTGLAPKPKDERDTTNASLRYCTMMSANTEVPEAAGELIQALYTADIYAPWLEKGFVTNVVQEYDTLPMWEGKRAQFNEAAKIGVYPGFPAPYDNAAMADLLNVGSNAPSGTMMVRVLIDGISIEDAIDESDEFAKQVFSRYF
jgi:ABC-type glycerol-3-phosphate transport system substrate-binding protein